MKAVKYEGSVVEITDIGQLVTLCVKNSLCNLYSFTI